MQIKGKIIAKAPSKNGVSSKGPWKKAFNIIRYEDGQYPKDILLGNMRDADSFERLSVGEEGVFFYDHTCREYNGNWYMDTNCWRWDISTPSGQSPQTPPPAESPQKEDLPF